MYVYILSAHLNLIKTSITCMFVCFCFQTNLHHVLTVVGLVVGMLVGEGLVLFVGKGVGAVVGLLVGLELATSIAIDIGISATALGDILEEDGAPR